MCVKFFHPKVSLLNIIYIIVDQSQPNVMWTSEELSLLERFFVQRVACAPYKQNNMLSFCRMTATPAKIIKDFIRIIRKQLVRFILIFETITPGIVYCQQAEIV